MEALRELIVARTGYPRYRSIAEAARESGIAQSLLSQYVRGVRRPDPPVLYRLASWLKAPYNDLLIDVWGASTFASQPPNDLQKDRSSMESSDDYIYQASGTRVVEFPRVWDRQLMRRAA